jgi:hypothetical protein
MGDFTGDGHLAVAVANHTDDTVSVLLAVTPSIFLQEVK